MIFEAYPGRAQAEGIQSGGGEKVHRWAQYSLPQMADLLSANI
jgi:hypothetical protein